MLKEIIMKGSKRSLILLSLLLFTIASFAVPAKPGLKRLLTLTDGTTVTATLVGDEHGHFWKGADGKAYQIVSGTNTFQEVNSQEIIQRAQKKRAIANSRRVKRLAPRKIGNVGTITGDKKGIIILVNFKDKSFTATQSDFNKLANQVNYNSVNYKGSMYDYFYAQSDGQFRLTFDVVGPVTVDKTQSYYGANDNDGNDEHPAEMVIEAIKLADQQVNFADYDWDGDKVVDQVYVVYAGKGEADGGSDDTIWPHEWQLSSAKQYGDGSGAQTLDGVKIDTYACGGEQNGETGATAGIGTMCHEFSHCLGYPDFYDTDYSGGQGMFEWDLMDSGSYNGDGYRPAGYTSYERWVAGWKEPIELVNTQSITNMKALQTTGSDTYIIYNKANNNEYYLLENRQQTGWDTSLPGKGLLILHVDYNSSAWSNNTPNDDPNHQRMTWIPADNKYQYKTYNGSKYYTEAGAANDPFPYGSVNAFGKNTTPAATLYNKNSDNTYYLDSSVENITQNSNGTISFLFRGLSNVEAPTFSPNGGSYDYGTSINVTISCGTSGASIYYTTDGSVPTTSSTLYTNALTFSSYTVLKAIAVKDGELSGVTEATYSFNEPIIVADESLTFSTFVGSSQTLPLEVLTENLTQDVTLTLTDANNVFSLNSNTISKSLNDATIDVTFAPTVVGTYTGSITLSSAGAETVTVQLSATAKEPSSSNPNTTTFKRVTSTDNLEEGMRYIIACGSAGKAAGALGSQILASEDVTVNSDVITITNDVAVFVLEGNQTEGWTFKNESTNEYLYATTTKKLAYSSTENKWTLGNGTAGVIMTYGDYGTMLCNVNSPRFTTYTSTPTASMIQANLYMEYDDGTTPSKQDVTMSFTPTSATATMGESFTAPILTTNPSGLTVTYSSSNTGVATVNSSTGAVTLVAAGTTTITATFAGNDNYNSGSATYTLTVSASSTPGGQTLLYEGVSDYSGNGDSSIELTTASSYLDFDNWTSISKVYPTSNAQSNGGGLKFGTSSAKGSIKTGSINLTGAGTLTFYLKQYGTDTGTMNVTVTGATADVTSFTPQSSWTLCTINLTNGTGNVAIELATSAKRAYVDEITLVSGSGGYTPTKEDVTMSFSPSSVEITQGSTFTTPTLTTDPSGLTVSYSSSNTSVATVNTSTGAVTIVGTGTTTITATFAGNESYNSGSASYTLTVNADTNTPGTENNPYTVAGAIAYINTLGSSTSSTDVYVSGIISKVDSYNSTYKSITYWISDDGTTTTQMEVYSGKGLNSADFSSLNDLHVGDEVTVCGKVKLFNSTPEFYYNNYLVAFNRPQKADVTMSFDPSSVELTLGDTFTAPTLTTDPTDLTVNYESSNTNVATVDISTGDVTIVGVGNATITATFAGNDIYNNGSASYSLTVSAASTPQPVTGSGYYALVTDASTLAAGDKILIAYVNGNECLVLSTTQNTNNRAATDDVTLNNDGTLTPGDAAQVITLEKDGSYYLFNVGSSYLYAASSSKNWLRTEETADDNAKATIVISGGNATITFQGSYTHNLLRYNDNDNLFSCYYSGQKAVQIYREVPLPSITLANNSDNSSIIESNNNKLAIVTLADRTLWKDGAWNTLCLPFEVSTTNAPFNGDDVTAMTLDTSTSGLDGSTLTLNFTAATTIPAGTPFIIKWATPESPAANLVNPVFNGVTISSATNNATVDNVLTFTGIYSPVSIGSTGDNTMLYLGDNNTLYYPSAAMTIGSQRAYFQLLNGITAGEPSSLIKSFVLNFDGDTDGIRSMDNGQWTMDNEAGVWYDLQGRKIGLTPNPSPVGEGRKLPRGIYIHNGRKVVIK